MTTKKQKITQNQKTNRAAKKVPETAPVDSSSSSDSSEATSLSSDSEESDSGSEESDDSDEESEKSTTPNSNDIMKSLQSVPVSKLKEIVTNQIDLEIRLKHKELKLTEEEIGKCESQMITLRNYYKIPGDKSFDNEPNDFTLKYYDLLNRSLSGNYAQESIGQASMDSTGDYNSPSGHSYRTRSTTSSLRPSTSSYLNKPTTIGCLYRRTDGVIVKLTCPGCQRSNFSSAQGFLNHSRIAHTQEYTSQDAAALICGQVLGDNEQDEEGLASLKSLRERNLDPSRNLNVNEIYFHGLSNSLNTVHNVGSIEKSLSPLEQDVVYKTSVAPADKENSALMKKLIKSGITKDESSYQELIESYKSTLEEGSIIDSSEDEIEEKRTSERSESAENKLKRRRSRGNVGILKSEKNETVAEREKSHPPLPKIKLRLKPEDRKKRKVSK